MGYLSELSNPSKKWSLETLSTSDHFSLVTVEGSISPSPPVALAYEQAISDSIRGKL